MTTEFNAPWSHSLKLATGIGAAFLCAIPLLVLLFPVQWQAALLLLGLPALTLLGTFVTSVRGYELNDTEILVKHPMGSTRLPLHDVKTVEGKSDAMNGRIRLFANSGLFAITGVFWNRQLGIFRAYATDPSRSVVLRLAKRKIVITPHDPQAFIMRARTAIKSLDSRPKPMPRPPGVTGSRKT